MTDDVKDLKELMHLSVRDASNVKNMNIKTFKRLIIKHGLALDDFGKRPKKEIKWTKEKILQLTSLTVVRAAEIVGMKPKTFRRFKKSMGIDSWPYRASKKNKNTVLDATNEAIDAVAERVIDDKTREDIEEKNEIADETQNIDEGKGTALQVKKMSVIIKSFHKADNISSDSKIEKKIHSKNDGSTNSMKNVFMEVEKQAAKPAFIDSSSDDDSITVEKQAEKPAFIDSSSDDDSITVEKQAAKPAFIDSSSDDDSITVEKQAAKPAFIDSSSDDDSIMVEKQAAKTEVVYNSSNDHEMTMGESSDNIIQDCHVRTEEAKKSRMQYMLKHFEEFGHLPEIL